ncbi:MAG: flavodoxin family protein [Limisphaerales bacterium]
MNNDLNRRQFVEVAATAAVAGSLTGVAAAETGAAAPRLKILGIACSPRRGMTTAKAVQTALDAAKGLDPQRIEVEFIDLGGLSIAGWSPNPPPDDFVPLLPKLQDPAVAGLIIGSPSYYRGLSALCKAFIERCAPLREPKMLLDGKPVGVVATGGFRNGGQELVIEQIQTAMLCFGMIPVGGRPPAFQGGTLLTAKDDLSGDELGLGTARNTGLRVADFALKLAGVKRDA